MPNPRTERLVKLAGTSASVRLTAADRQFLQDLAKVQLISRDLADKHHYSHLKGASVRSLERLEKAGIISSKILHAHGRPPTPIYQFASRSLASAWGGKLPITGAKRNDLHELMSSHAYFEMGRPATFKLAADFTKEDIVTVGSIRPDAMYTDAESGEVVIIEADSGHYNQKQIQKKLRAWRSAGLTRQVWAQPAHKRCARVPEASGVAVFRF